MFEQKRERLCKYYLQGRCTFKDNCRFSHDVIECFLIRHAESQFNQKVSTRENDDSPYYGEKQFQFSNTLIDCGITKEGFEQIASIDFSKLGFDVRYGIDCILVSPLQRALITAAEIIRIHHVNCKKVIVLKDLTQVLSKICDFMGPIDIAKKRYPYFDFGYFEESIKYNRQSWQDQLVDQRFKQLIDPTRQYGERYIQALKVIFPEPFQSSYECYGRSMRVLSEIKKICLKEGFRKILIVSHNRILKYISGRNNGGKAQSLHNCEIRHTYI